MKTKIIAIACFNHPNIKGTIELEEKNQKVLITIDLKSNKYKLSLIIVLSKKMYSRQ